MKNTKHGKEPATTKSDAKPEKAFGLDQGWGVVILAVALMCLGGAVSYFGGKPQILYIAAFGICLLVFYGTHRLVASELKSLSAADELKNNSVRFSTQSSFVSSEPLNSVFCVNKTMTLDQAKAVYLKGWTKFLPQR